MPTAHEVARMYRLFVAVDLPETIKDQLAAMQRDIPSAAWVKRQAFHLTLRFIGDSLPTDSYNAIRAALATISAPPFEAALNDVGRFPAGSRKPARVVWVGVDAPPALAALHQSVEQALVGVGFPPDSKGFSPHITLARIKTPQPAAVDRFLAEHAGLQTIRFPVREFVLYSSMLTPQGSQYTKEAVYPLSL